MPTTGRGRDRRARTRTGPPLKSRKGPAWRRRTTTRRRRTTTYFLTRNQNRRCRPARKPKRAISSTALPISSTESRRWFAPSPSTWRDSHPPPSHSTSMLTRSASVAGISSKFSTLKPPTRMTRWPLNESPLMCKAFLY